MLWGVQEAAFGLSDWDLGRRSQTVGMKSRVHPKYKTKYRVKNWASYDRAVPRHY